MARVGIIAWGGKLPVLLAAELRARDMEPLIVAVEGAADVALEQAVGGVHWVPPLKLVRTPKVLKREGVGRIVLAGPNRREVRTGAPKSKRWLFAGFGARKGPRGELDLPELQQALQAEGIEVLPQTFGMDRYVPAPGTLSQRAPSDEERRDVALGVQVGSQIGDLGMGRTVLVKAGTLLAVQGAEESDSTILRGGSLGGPGAVAVRAPCCAADLLFQAPTLSDETVVACLDAGIKVLAFEGGKTLFFERERSFELADRNDITLLAY